MGVAALGQRHNDMSQTLHTHRVRQRSADSPLHEPAVESAVLISRKRHKSTPDMVYDIFSYVTDKAHLGNHPYGGAVCLRTTALVSTAMWVHARASVCCQAQRGTDTGMLWHLLSQRK